VKVVKQSRVFYGHILVLSGFLIMLSMYGTLYSFGVFLKPLLKELGQTRASVSGSYSLCFFLSGALAVAAGRLNDTIGPRVVISWSGTMIGLGYVLMSTTTTVVELYLYLGLLVGVGMSGGIAPVLSTIAKWFDKRRGLMIGFAVAGVGTGTLAVPPVANALISAHGWRASFFIMGITTFALIVGFAQFFVRDPVIKGLRPYGSESAKSDEDDHNIEGLSLHDACRSVQLWTLFAIYVCSGFCVQIALVHTTIYAISLGASPARGAMLLSVMGVGSLAGRIFGGAASDRFGNRLMMIAASILMAILFSMIVLSGNTRVLLLFAGFFGVVYGQILCMMPLLPAELFGLKNHGSILGVITLASTIGGSMGPVVAGAIFDGYGGYRNVWVTCTAASVATLLLALSMKKPEPANG